MLLLLPLVLHAFVLVSSMFVGCCCCNKSVCLPGERLQAFSGVRTVLVP